MPPTAAIPPVSRRTVLGAAAVASVVVGGWEIGHNLNGVDPRDPHRQHSFYVDEGGRRTRLVCTEPARGRPTSWRISPSGQPWHSALSQLDPAHTPHPRRTTL